MRPTKLIEQPWLDRFIAAIRPGGDILDIGCGNATPIAAYLLSREFSVTGVDASPSMVARCREKFPLSKWITADMRTLDLGMTFDGILAWDSFFHLSRSDQRQMFGIFSAHARDGATLMFNTGPNDGEAIGEFQGEPLYHSSLSPDEYQSFLKKSGFRLIQHVVEDQLCGGRTIWLAGKC